MDKSSYLVPSFKKIFMIILIACLFFVVGCATTGGGGGSQNAVESKENGKETIQSECAPNFTIDGNFASGRVFNAFKDYRSKSKEKVFATVVTTVSMKLKGWQVINSDKESGLISASQGSIGGPTKSAMNIMVTRVNQNTVRVEVSRKVAPFNGVSTDGIMQVFCTIFSSI